MKIIVRTYIIFLNGVYLLFKMLPTQNKIVFISRQTDKPSLDFRSIKSEIESYNLNIKMVFITKKVKKTLIENIRNIVHTFIQMYHLATSKVCITDGYNISISVLRHKKDLKIYQIWHSLAAIKKFGHQSLNTERKKIFAKAMRMHRKYSYIITGSKAMIKYFSKAFKYPKEKFIPLGLPRIDYLLNKSKTNRKKIYKVYPRLRHKKVILYVPTFRDNNNYKISTVIRKFNLTNCALIIKPHSNMPKLKFKNNKDIYTCDEFTSLQLLSIADYVITDYSAISVEAAVLNKPIYLYTYDLEEYKKSPGLNVNLNKDLPGYVFNKIGDIYKDIKTNKYNLNVVKGFRKKYVTPYEGRCTKEITKFILESSGMIEKKN